MAELSQAQLPELPELTRALGAQDVMGPWCSLGRFKMLYPDETCCDLRPSLVCVTVLGKQAGAWQEMSPELYLFTQSSDRLPLEPPASKAGSVAHTQPWEGTWARDLPGEVSSSCQGCMKSWSSGYSLSRIWDFIRVKRVS